MSHFNHSPSSWTCSTILRLTDDNSSHDAIPSSFPNRHLPPAPQPHVQTPRSQTDSFDLPVCCPFIHIHRTRHLFVCALAATCFYNSLAFSFITDFTAASSLAADMPFVVRSLHIGYGRVVRMIRMSYTYQNGDYHEELYASSASSEKREWSTILSLFVAI